MKIQFRDVDSFIHKDYRTEGIRYIGRPGHASELGKLRSSTRPSRDNMITMATPFDEVSVDKCVEFKLQILKIASSDIKDWLLIEKIARPENRSSRPQAALR